MKRNVSADRWRAAARGCRPRRTMQPLLRRPARASSATGPHCYTHLPPTDHDAGRSADGFPGPAAQRNWRMAFAPLAPPTPNCITGGSRVFRLLVCTKCSQLSGRARLGIHGPGVPELTTGPSVTRNLPEDGLQAPQDHGRGTDRVHCPGKRRCCGCCDLLRRCRRE